MFLFNRWIEQNLNEFIGVLGPYIVRLQHQYDNLRYTFFINRNYLKNYSNDNDRRVESAIILHNYFQLTIKLNDAFEKWSKTDVRFRKGQIPHGIRILAQEPLETLISCICSSNKSVQRTSNMIKLLCYEYGKKIGTLNGITYYQFPTLGRLFFVFNSRLSLRCFILDELDQPDLEIRLRELNFGYRARHIYETVKFIKYTAGGTIFFDRLKALSVKEARRQLTKIMGVSQKVKSSIKMIYCNT